MKAAFRMQYSALALLFATVGAHAASVQVLSATVKDQVIPGATVILQKNGEASASALSDAQGKAQLAPGFPDNGETLIILKKDGYSNLVAKCPCEGMTYAMSPVMRNLDGMRIVLTWGANPRDLDSHIVYPGNNIYYASKRGTDANLDVDDTDSFGPETITLERKHEGETYVYAVHDYTHRGSPSSTDLSASEAKVFVYVGQSLVRTYYVPTGKVGNLWTVFRITGEGEFQDINTVRGVNTDSQNVIGQVSSYTNEQTAVVAANEGPANPVRSKAQNLAGESAYHAGRLDDAIALFQSAIELNPNNGQAYSNLGLSYQKAGRAAEAIWADRKAIALASGPNAATIRASSYFNIAKLYEDAGQNEDALNNYKSARREKANPVYDKAIQRLGGTP
ncbi:hypothetical protein FHW69_001044 [Luteibacter sp. Sphag1AF]|uniref:tetratricopeptide repeat protein n=1 Tax=Luteibacter sp. Sphag1AF TaxID=2587031 RepID=UPI001799F8E0|nr:tetratricopeptide repeat protein [Luteibacter sp. Sphag1AF]MBB3226454.1 hypothetical protein [Luteibacter sp. Sphag1AF]